MRPTLWPDTMKYVESSSPHKESPNEGNRRTKPAVVIAATNTTDNLEGLSCMRSRITHLGVLSRLAFRAPHEAMVRKGSSVRVRRRGGGSGRIGWPTPSPSSHRAGFDPLAGGDSGRLCFLVPRSHRRREARSGGRWGRSDGPFWRLGASIRVRHYDFCRLGWRDAGGKGSDRDYGGC